MYDSNFFVVEFNEGLLDMLNIDIVLYDWHIFHVALKRGYENIQLL